MNTIEYARQVFASCTYNRYQPPPWVTKATEGTGATGRVVFVPWQRGRFAVAYVRPLNIESSTVATLMMEAVEDSSSASGWRWEARF